MRLNIVTTVGMLGWMSSHLIPAIVSQEADYQDNYGGYPDYTASGGGAGDEDYYGDSVSSSRSRPSMASSASRADMAYATAYNDDDDDPQQPDNLYHDYAIRQQEKTTTGGGGGMGMGPFLLGCASSWFVGAKFHSGRTARKLKTKFQKEQKELYAQYYNDVYKLTEQNQELQYAVQSLQGTLRELQEKHELEALQRDYDEFKQPDIDGDDRISRAEFNMYVKNYLSNYPGLSEKDYPRFEDFDHDGDGYVSFQEYSQQMALQAQKAEMEQMYGGGSSSSQNKAKAYQDLASGSNFEEVYRKKQQQQRG